MSSLVTRLGAVALAAAAGLAAVACGGPPPDPATLLREARVALDSAPALHFHLSSSNVQGRGALVTGGDGDARRPGEFRGSLDVSLNGLLATIDIVSTGGAFYVRLPLRTGYERAEPAAYGFGDPAVLLNRDHGLSSLLTAATAPVAEQRDRYQGEELDEVAATLPGRLVAALLTSADPARPVKAGLGIDATHHQLRRVVLTGPFFDAHRLSTYTVILDRYGENVTVSPPL